MKRATRLSIHDPTLAARRGRIHPVLIPCNLAPVEICATDDGQMTRLSCANYSLQAGLERRRSHSRVPSSTMEGRCDGPPRGDCHFSSCQTCWAGAISSVQREHDRDGPRGVTERGGRIAYTMECRSPRSMRPSVLGFQSGARCRRNLSTSRSA